MCLGAVGEMAGNYDIVGGSSSDWPWKDITLIIYGFEEVSEVVNVVVDVIGRHAIVLIDREVLHRWSRIHISEHQKIGSTSACGRSPFRRAIIC